jgi:hypothetical protein
VSSNGHEPGLIDRDTHDELDSAVRTFAETLYEAGFPPELALDIAWSLTTLPALTKRVTEDDW